MALRMLRPFRRDGKLERLRRRHLPAVYHFALAVLPDELDAQEVTRAAVARARGRRMFARRRLVDAALELARARVPPAGGGPDAPLEGGECAEAERLLSRALDGGLPRRDRRRLARHLASCAGCRAHRRSLVAVRRAVRSLRTVPVPRGLLDERFTSSGRRGSLATEERSAVGIVNRRNAMLGWAAWKVGKRVARRKAKDAVPSVDPETKRPNKSAAIAAAVAAAVGGLVFWRRQRGSGSSEPPE